MNSNSSFMKFNSASDQGHVFLNSGDLSDLRSMLSVFSDLLTSSTLSPDNQKRDNPRPDQPFIKPDIDRIDPEDSDNEGNEGNEGDEDNESDEGDEGNEPNPPDEADEGDEDDEANEQDEDNEDDEGDENDEDNEGNENNEDNEHNEDDEGNEHNEDNENNEGDEDDEDDENNETTYPGDNNEGNENDEDNEDNEDDENNEGDENDEDNEDNEDDEGDENNEDDEGDENDEGDEGVENNEGDEGNEDDEGNEVDGGDEIIEDDKAAADISTNETTKNAGASSSIDGSTRELLEQDRARVLASTSEVKQLLVNDESTAIQTLNEGILAEIDLSIYSAPDLDRENYQERLDRDILVLHYDYGSNVRHSNSDAAENGKQSNPQSIPINRHDIGGDDLQSVAFATSKDPAGGKSGRHEQTNISDSSVGANSSHAGDTRNILADDPAFNRDTSDTITGGPINFARYQIETTWSRESIIISRTDREIDQKTEENRGSPGATPDVKMLNTNQIQNLLESNSLPPGHDASTELPIGAMNQVFAYQHDNDLETLII
jgi:hypothetical protein